jgi:hypothetical protein
MLNELTEGQCNKEQSIDRDHNIVKYYVAIAIDIFLLYIVNNLVSIVAHPLDQFASKDYPGIIVSIVNWVSNFQSSFLTHDFVSCLWAINLALGLGIIGNFVLLLYRPNWFYHLIQAVICATGFFAVYLVFKTFPFVISTDAWRIVIRALLIMAMAGFCIGLIIELIIFVRSPISTNKTNPPENNIPGPM